MSGTLNYALIAGASLDPLLSTPYGRLLLGKITLFGGMLVLAALNRFRLSPNLENALKTNNQVLAFLKLRQSLFIEATLATLVLAVVAWLGILSPNEI